MRLQDQRPPPHTTGWTAPWGGPQELPHGEGGEGGVEGGRRGEGEGGGGQEGEAAAGHGPPRTLVQGGKRRGTNGWIARPLCAQMATLPAPDRLAVPPIHWCAFPHPGEPH